MLVISVGVMACAASAAIAGPPQKAVDNAPINLLETIRSNAGGGNGGEYGNPQAPEIVNQTSDAGTPTTTSVRPGGGTCPHTSCTYTTVQTSTQTTTYEQTTPEIDPGKSGAQNQAPEPGDETATWTNTTTQTSTTVDAPAGAGPQDSYDPGTPVTTCTGDCPP